MMVPQSQPSGSGRPPPGVRSDGRLPAGLLRLPAGFRLPAKVQRESRRGGGANENHYAFLLLQLEFSYQTLVPAAGLASKYFSPRGGDHVSRDRTTQIALGSPTTYNLHLRPCAPRTIYLTPRHRASPRGHEAPSGVGRAMWAGDACCTCHIRIKQLVRAERQPLIMLLHRSHPRGAGGREGGGGRAGGASSTLSTPVHGIRLVRCPSTWGIWCCTGTRRDCRLPA